MKIQQFQPVYRSDVPDSPTWIEKFMGPVNDQVKDLTVMAQGQTTYEDNLNAEPRELKVTHDEWQEVTLQKLRGKPVGFWVEFWDLDDYAMWKWELLDLDRIRFKIKFNTAPSEEVLVRILVRGK